RGAFSLIRAVGIPSRVFAGSCGEAQPRLSSTHGLSRGRSVPMELAEACPLSARDPEIGGTRVEAPERLLKTPAEVGLERPRVRRLDVLMRDRRETLERLVERPRFG